MIEIVAIGNELLAGYTVNSNAAFIGRQLLSIGWNVGRHTVLPDEPTALKEGLEQALARSDILICTGGLGPTGDDITAEIAAQIFCSPFAFNEEVAADLHRRFGSELTTIENQATLPSLAIPWLNSVGTAPALLFEKEGKIALFLPGVPLEMETFCTRNLIPYLKQKFGEGKEKRRKILYFFALREEKIDPILRQIGEEEPQLSYGIYPGGGVVAVHLVAKSEEDKAEKIIEKGYKKLYEQFNKNILPSPNGLLEEAVALELVRCRETISVAESCTGGGIAARLTSLAGASQFFLGGVVAYSNEFKVNFLGVGKELLEKHGAVSSEVVEAMAEGIMNKTGSDWSLAVSGIAGPSGGSEDKPVGTVWMALLKRGEKPFSKLLSYKNTTNRSKIIDRAINDSLVELIQKKVFNG